MYHGNDEDIILIDEPCAHLSSQNKIKFRDKFLSKTIDKQLIIITHDIELVNANSNLLHFSYVKNITVPTKIEEINDQIKNINEHPNILFSSKCLFVEGYSDLTIDLLNVSVMLTK